MYIPHQKQDRSVSLDVIDSAFEDINKNSIELTKLLNEFSDDSSAVDAQNVLVKSSILIGYMISLRNQLLIFKRESSIAGNATAKEYLNELKVQMDGLKSIMYAYGAILSAVQESKKLDQKMM